ncbi:MAG TPA: cytochrome C, partial [Bacteroidota bacterium]|nr:cytochrome C [Bacteroidota bacterium]
MNYPIWDLTTFGGPSLIALIAVLHVYISHLAVGGGLFLWLTDRKAARTGDARLTDYVRRHTWFFLLLTMVFGGVSGVGIWFIIALVQPAATSSLIHTFVFGWAIEWVFFVGEIVALLIYHYRFTVMAERDRLRVAFLYFLFAWLSMVVINGILAFMLTPGRWLETRGFWDGFFNPTYFSSLAFRSFMAAMLGGLFGFITAVYTKDEAFRTRLMRYCSKWLIYPFIGLVPSAIWYYYSLPDEIRERTFAMNPQTHPFVLIFIVASAILFLVGLLQMRRSSLPVQRILTALLVVIGLSWIGGYEYVREIARKPFVIGNFMYSTSILVDDAASLDKNGVLQQARWTDTRSITPENRATAGKELFRLECQSCHTVNGIRNDIVPRIRNFTYLGMLSHLTGQGKIQTYMPPFFGTEQEKEALAFYLTTVLNGKEADIAQEDAAVPQGADALPPLGAGKSEYILLAWNDLGMHCMTDGDAWFSFLPPANTLEAQLIKRGDPPQIVTDGVELTYAVEKGLENPAAHVAFWKHAESLYGARPEENVGLFGKGMQGSFVLDSARNSFVARGVPAVPYADDGSYNPYPMFTVEAHDPATDALLIATSAIAPVSTEIGCRNCHEGGWRKGSSGLSDETARNILAAHDRMNNTTLLADAKGGRPLACQHCHPDPAVAAEGKPGVLDLSAAMHGWHANYMPTDDAEACGLCHPSRARGNTRCLRDPHSALGLDCITCHGTLSENAVAQLNGQSDKPSAARLLAPLAVENKDGIKPRTAWHGQPDCLNCHADFEPPTGDTGFNQWTATADELYRMRTDFAGVRCPACHGSTHALYPAHNPINRDRDNIQPMQYTGSRGPIGSNNNCTVCHT